VPFTFTVATGSVDRVAADLLAVPVGTAPAPTTPKRGSDAPARVLVELGVLDRAADERRRVHEEVEDVVVELARRLGVQDDHADHVVERVTLEAHGT